jgi:hypothetical protein
MRVYTIVLTIHAFARYPQRQKRRPAYTFEPESQKYLPIFLHNAAAAGGEPFPSDFFAAAIPPRPYPGSRQKD